MRPIVLLLLLTALATRFFWARSAWTWSLAGAVTGILFAIMLFGGPRPYDASASAVYQWGITAAACAAVGIVSANMFRWTIKLLNKMFAPSPA